MEIERCQQVKYLGIFTLLEPKIRAHPNERDMVIIRVIARGLKDGQEKEIHIDLCDYHDETTGFTADALPI